MNQKEILKIFRVPPKLETDRLVLRMIEKKDCRDMFDYASHEDVTRFLSWSPHPNVDYTRGYIKVVHKHYRSGDFYDWAIVYKADGKMIGTVGFTGIDVKNNLGEIGYVLNPKYYRMGLATEAAKRVVKFGFDVIGLNRIEAKFMPGNEASHRVMEKIGMKFEGTGRQVMFVKGEYKDISVCAITKDEYDALNE